MTISFNEQMKHKKKLTDFGEFKEVDEEDVGDK